MFFDFDQNFEKNKLLHPYNHLRPFPKSYLALLDPIQNSAIRLCTGAFRTSPQLSLCADSGIPPLNFHRLSLPASLLFFISCLPNTNIYSISYSAQTSNDQPTIKPPHPYQLTFNKPSRKSSISNASRSSFLKPPPGPCYNPSSTY